MIILDLYISCVQFKRIPVIKINELRIGSIVVDKINNQIIRISGISDNDYITTRKSIEEENINLDQIEPLYLNNNLVSQLIKFGIIKKAPDKKNIYNFPGETTTYFLVDLGSDNFIIGMIDVNLPEEYRRLTRQFSEYHKLQNAFNAVFDKELTYLHI